MATNPEYAAYIVDLLTPHYPISTRKMFGGVGIFCEYGMCALITKEDTLYFKADEKNRDDFIDADMPQFHKMPYFELPPETLDSADDLGVWLTKSVDAARRAPKKKKR